uniref:Uncharacterized protein n=1 Tax=Anopheles culicifacies TaxID=139723 RepID=A0A182M9C2_9DIPT
MYCISRSMECHSMRYDGKQGCSVNYILLRTLNNGKLANNNMEWPRERTRAPDTIRVGLVLLAVVMVVVLSTLVAAATPATGAICLGNGSSSGSTRGTKSVQILTAGGPWLSIGEVTWPQLELISLRFAHRRTDHYDQHDEHG